MGIARTAVLAVALLAGPARAEAQLGEVQLGASVAYGPGKVYGTGAGPTIGLSAGRLAYLGLRWTLYEGSTAAAGPPTARVHVTSRAQVGALDLGVVIPVGPFELIPGASVGVVWFRQRSRPDTGGGAATTLSLHAEEFLVAPGVSAEIHTFGVVFIPQMQYYLSGQPDLPWPARNGGLLTSVRLVVPIEVRRIRR